MVRWRAVLGVCVVLSLVGGPMAAQAAPGDPPPDAVWAVTTDTAMLYSGPTDEADTFGTIPPLVTLQVLGYDGDIERAQSLTPDGSPAEVWEEIRARKTEDAILLASHEPLMSATAAFLLGAPGLQVDMKKAALARVDVDRFGPQPLGWIRWTAIRRSPSREKR